MSQKLPEKNGEKQMKELSCLKTLLHPLLQVQKQIIILSVVWRLRVKYQNSCMSTFKNALYLSFWEIWARRKETEFLWLNNADECKEERVWLRARLERGWELAVLSIDSRRRCYKLNSRFLDWYLFPRCLKIFVSVYSSSICLMRATQSFPRVYNMSNVVSIPVQLHGHIGPP